MPNVRTEVERGLDSSFTKGKLVNKTQLIEALSAHFDGNRRAAAHALESVVDTVIDSRPFREVFREAARQSNRLLFVRDRSGVAFDVSDGVEVVKFGLRSVAPQLADEIRLSIDYYMTQPQAKPVGEIVVSGPGSGDEQLVESLGVHLGLPTTVAAPLGVLDRSALAPHPK